MRPARTTHDADDGSVVVGVALAIPTPHSTVLSKWRTRIGDPAGELVWPHVTLLPPTPVAPDSLDLVEKHLATVAAAQEPFVMHLAGTGTFRPTSPVVFIQIATGVSQCELLESAIRRGPLDRALDFPYHPHVTVAQGVDDERLDEAYEGLSGFIARFPVAGFGLFSRSVDGRWARRTEFALGGPNPRSGGTPTS